MTDTRLNVDGVPHDGVGHDLATAEHLARYEEANDALRRLRAPILVHSYNRHERLFVVAFDGTGNNKFSDPAHATNVAKIYDQLDEVTHQGNQQIYAGYVEGPGTRGDKMIAGTDSAFGHTYEANIREAYGELVVQANAWATEDPKAVVRVHSMGFSRGGSQAAGFARHLDQYGIPDLTSEFSYPDGSLGYSQYLVDPGKTVQTVGLFDPVATGAPMKFDRRLPPSVVSGFQITSADEHRASFPSDQIIPPGLSEDGRFLNVMVPGAHSDVGGGYLRDGLSIRCGNLMRDYCNALRDVPYLQKEFEPTDQRLNVIHRSTEGKSLFRIDPRGSVRGEPSGTNARLAPGHVKHAGPAPHGPEPVNPRLDDGLLRRHVAIGPANMQPSRAPFPPASAEAVMAAGRSAPFAPTVGRLGGAAATVVDVVEGSQRAIGSWRDGNTTGALSQTLHFGSRNVAGWAGAEALAAAGAAVGVESGPGMFLTAAVGGVVGFVQGDKLVDAYDQYCINYQSDSGGNTWRLDAQHGWTRDVPPLPGSPQGQLLTADAALSNQLSYQASNTAVELALARDYAPRDPFTQPAARGDAPSIKEAPWTHNARTHEWTRQVADQRLEHGLSRSHIETANPQRAAELDRLAEQTIQQNVAESAFGVAQRYRVAYERHGWAQHGPMPESVAHALTSPAEKVLASDGHSYTHSADDVWSRPGMFFGTNSADVRVREELDASVRATRGLMDGVDAVALAHSAAKSPQALGLTDARGRSLRADGATMSALQQAGRATQEPKVDASQGAATGHPDTDATRTLQQTLNTLGATDMRGEPLAVDGIFGVATQTAVARFQSGHGLPITGQADEATRSMVQGQAFIAELQQTVPPVTKAAPTVETARYPVPEHASPEQASESHSFRPSEQSQVAHTLNDPRHPDSPTHRLYNELEQCIPGASENRLLQFTAACHKNMITADNLSTVHVDEERMTIDFRGTGRLSTPAQVDLSVPPPKPQEAILQIQQFDQQEMQLAQAYQMQQSQIMQQGRSI